MAHTTRSKLTGAWCHTRCPRSPSMGRHAGDASCALLVRIASVGPAAREGAGSSSGDAVRHRPGGGTPGGREPRVFVNGSPRIDCRDPGAVFMAVGTFP